MYSNYQKSKYMKFHLSAFIYNNFLAQNEIVKPYIYNFSHDK